MGTSWLGLMIFSLGVFACMLPLFPFLRGDNPNPPKLITFTTIFLAALYQIYFWGLWSSYCVAVVMRFTQKTEVTSDWLYWVCGFMWCSALIGWLSAKEQQGQTLKNAQATQRGTLLYKSLAIVAFAMFALYPSLCELPYGWFFKLTGLSDYIFADL